MSTQKTASHIGDERVHKFMANQYRQWEWQQPVETIEDYRGQVDNDADIVFIIDRLHDMSGENKEFEKLVTEVSQNSMVGILNYHPEHQDTIQNSITDYAEQNGLPQPEYYFIDKDRPIETIDEAVSTHFKENNNDNAENHSFV